MDVARHVHPGGTVDGRNPASGIHPERAWAMKATVWIRNGLLLLVGAVISALAVNLFYVPPRLTMGGVSGLVSILFQVTGRGEFLPFGTMVILANIPLLVLGWRVFSFRFVLGSLLGTFFYSLAIDLTAPACAAIHDQYLNRPVGGSLPDLLIYCLFGGALYGLGLGLIFRAGCNTGGTDIAAKVIKRYYRGFSLGQFILILDALILAVSAVAYRFEEESSVLLAMYSATALFVSAKVIDLVLEGFDYCKTALIISDNSEAIAPEILQGMGRGVTALKGRGLYTGTDKEVLLCVLLRQEVATLKDLVRRIDPRAFVIVLEAREVLGEGFERYEIKDA